MFRAKETPRVFGVSLGQDFSKTLHAGLSERFAKMAPTDVAKVDIYVNTRRMARHLESLFHTGPAMLLPRIRLVTDLAQDAFLEAIPPSIAPLRRRLEVAQLVRKLIESDPSLASQDAAFDLAESLVALMAEMQGEGVAPDIIRDLNITDQSGHWERALRFIQLVQPFFDDGHLDGEGRQRAVIEKLIAQWQKTPPQHPILVAGSTGSRGATSLFMQAVAKLPQGALILPGFDYEMPDDVWGMLSPERGGEDHPQFRFKALCDDLDIPVNAVEPWTHGQRAQHTSQHTCFTLLAPSARHAPMDQRRARFD